MRKNNNIIEINGHRYDAKSGVRLSHAPRPSNQPSAKPPAVKTKPLHTAKPKPAAHSAARQPAKQQPSHRPEASHALMRQAVKKPGPSLKRRHKAQGHLDALAEQPLAKLTTKQSAQQLDEQRLRHAKQTPKSRLISHFPAFTLDNASQASWLASEPAPHERPRPKPSIPAVQSGAAGRGQRPKTTAELLEQAVEQATSHQQLPPKLPRSNRVKRNLGVGGAAVLSVLLLGVIVTQNLSNVRLQMASAKAGFNASLPAYQPAGFSLGQLNYSDGVVAAQFHSSGNNRHYSITQKRSSWDSRTLRDTFVAPSDPGYQTVQTGDRTIYLYDNRSATWTYNGIWYVIQTDGSLSDQQLVNLADSL